MIIFGLINLVLNKVINYWYIHIYFINTKTKQYINVYKIYKLKDWNLSFVKNYIIIVFW